MYPSGFGTRRILKEPDRSPGHRPNWSRELFETIDPSQIYPTVRGGRAHFCCEDHFPVDAEGNRWHRVVDNER